MATAQKNRAETEEQNGGPRLHKYVVLSDAVVVTVGKKANGKAEYTRVNRGGTINGTEESEQIQTLLRAKAIMRVTSKEQLAEVQADLAHGSDTYPGGRPKSRFRQTARVASQAMGAPDDPVQAPDPAVLPVTPTQAAVEQVLVQTAGDDE